MNMVKFYRRRPDGLVDVARVSVTQKKRGLRKKPSVRVAEIFMARNGWTRTRLYTTLVPA